MRSVADNWGAFKRLRLIYGYGSIPINTIFRGMNIHLPAILMFTRGTRFWHTAILLLPGGNSEMGGETAEFSTWWSPPGRAPGFPWRLPIVGGPVGPVDSDLSKIQIFLQSIFEFLSLHWYVKPFFDMFNVSILMFFSVKLNQESVICSCMFTFNMGWWTCKPPILGLPKYSRII